jgi:hypothetical protein
MGTERALSMMWIGNEDDLEEDLAELAPGGRWTELHLHLRVFKTPNGAILRCYPNRTVHLQGRNAVAADLFMQLDRRNRFRARKLGLTLPDE